VKTNFCHFLVFRFVHCICCVLLCVGLLFVVVVMFVR
jgi:hypothetical protein